MVAIVSGASRGIGYETCIALAREGVKKVIALSRDVKSLQKLKSSIHSEYPNCVLEPLFFDLMDEESFISFDKYLAEHHPKGIDILINNAGYLVNKPFLELQRAEIQSVFEVNVVGLMKLTALCIPYIREGNVLSISSIGGVQGSVKFPGLSAYSSSKAAVIAFTECMAEEFKESKLHFNCLALGAVQTEMLNEAFPGYIAKTKADEVGAFIADFTMKRWTLFNGKTISLSSSTP